MEDPNCNLLHITPTDVSLDLCHFKFLNITTNEYNLISDPPIFTDIGFNYLSLGDLSFHTQFTPQVTDGQLKLDMHELSLDMIFDFDWLGISDMSKVFTNTVNTLVNVVYGRFKNGINHSWAMLEKDIEEGFSTLFELPATY